jgi:hypothetical protein
MRKGLVVVSLLAILVVAGCQSGPSYLSRSVDDWQNNNYEKQPLVTMLLTDVVPFYPVVKILAMVPDVLILNPVQFWGHDVWDGVGSAFVHDNPEGTKKHWFKK